MASTQEPLTINGEVTVGLINNSALSIDELDEVSSEGDTAIEKNATIGALWRVTDKAKISSSYRYNEQDYNALDNFDLALHQISIDSSYQWNKKDLGLRYDGAIANLKGEQFLSFQQASVYLGTFLQPHTFLRTSAKLKTKKFTDLSNRNADAFGASADIFHFMNNGNTMLMLGLSADKESAIDPQYEHNSYGINTKLSQKFELFGLAQKAAIVWRFQSKDYHSFSKDNADNTQNATKTDEHRSIFQVQWQLIFNKHFAIINKLEYGDYHAQLESQTYQQTISSIAIKAQF